jgi:hypothetical protein
MTFAQLARWKLDILRVSALTGPKFFAIDHDTGSLVHGVWEWYHENVR